MRPAVPSPLLTDVDAEAAGDEAALHARRAEIDVAGQYVVDARAVFQAQRGDLARGIGIEAGGVVFQGPALNCGGTGPRDRLLGGIVGGQEGEGLAIGQGILGHDRIHHQQHALAGPILAAQIEVVGIIGRAADDGMIDGGKGGGIGNEVLVGDLSLGRLIGDGRLAAVGGQIGGQRRGADQRQYPDEGN